MINDAPLISILSPLEGGVFVDTATIRVRFTASDIIGGVQGVRLYLDEKIVKSSEIPVDRFELDTIPAGSHSVFVEAEDSYGFTGRSETVNFRVEELAVYTGSLPFSNSTIRVGPNPFNDRVQFRIHLAEAARVQYKVYDLKGTLHHIGAKVHLPAGKSILVWNGSGQDVNQLPRGEYICHFLVDDGKQLLTLITKLIKQ